MKFAKRIQDYCDRHPERINPNRAKWKDKQSIRTQQWVKASKQDIKWCQ
jgi:hypothetical protein